MKRIGILGGTFNPVHIGHLAMAQTALEQLKLDKVIFVPSNLPPHKASKEVVSAMHRFKMVQLAVKGNPKFEVSSVEIKRSGKSYSIDTVKYFKKLYLKGDQIFFIIGEDTLKTLHSWKYIKELLKSVKFVSINRLGYQNTKSKVKTVSIKMPALEVASSYIRQRLVSKKTVRYLIPDLVLKYIQKNKLYV